KHGEMGLAITSLSLGAVTLLFFLYIFFTIDAGVAGLFSGGSLRGSILIILFYPLVEMARLTLFAIFQWAVGKSTRDDDLASSSVLLAILVPSVSFGELILTYLLGLMFAKSMSTGVVYLMRFFVFIELAAWIGLLAWFTLNTSNAKRAIDDAT